MCSNILNVFISTSLGVLSSFTAWYITFKCIVPKIRFSDSISKTLGHENPSGIRYRFKFENYGNRNIMDLEVIVRLRIKGIREDLPNNWEVVYLPTSTLSYDKIAIVRPFKRDGVRPILEIKTHECQYFVSSLFEKTIRTKAINKTLTLDDVLSIREEAEFQILILGFDGFSGSRKFFESKTYRAGDIKKGHFDQNGLNVIE